MTKGANAVVALIDLEKIPAGNIYDLSNQDLFDRMVDRFGKTNFFTTLRDEGVVAVNGTIPVTAVVKLVGVGPNHRNAGPATRAITKLLGS